MGLKTRINPVVLHEFFGTAPTHLLYAQHEALKIMKEEGKTVFQRHKKLQQIVTTAVNHWGESGPMKLNVQNEHHRSNAVTTSQAPGHDLNKLREWVEVNLGLIIGVSLGFDPKNILMGNPLRG